MAQFYVLEIQEYEDGTYGHLVHWGADEDPVKARMKAESKYHEVLAAAAVSQLPMHSASLIAVNGNCLMHQSYEHNKEE